MSEAAIDLHSEVEHLEAEITGLQDDVALLRKALKDVEARIPVDPDPFRGGAQYMRMKSIIYNALKLTGGARVH